ncbi:MAG: hypothetical protein KGL46_11840 [Hyphomicrobiales bacterium]|nr:hypothetical protein [Hyphomicrobiales bacterium]
MIGFERSPLQQNEKRSQRSKDAQDEYEGPHTRHQGADDDGRVEESSIVSDRIFALNAFVEPAFLAPFSNSQQLSNAIIS